METKNRVGEKEGVTMDAINEEQLEQKGGGRRMASEPGRQFRLVESHQIREMWRGLARRPHHRHTVRSRRKRAIEGIMYALAKLQRVARMTHRTTALRGSLLESDVRRTSSGCRVARRRGEAPQGSPYWLGHASHRVQA